VRRSLGNAPAELHLILTDKEGDIRGFPKLTVTREVHEKNGNDSTKSSEENKGDHLIGPGDKGGRPVRKSIGRVWDGD